MNLSFKLLAAMAATFTIFSCTTDLTVDGGDGKEQEQEQEQQKEDGGYTGEKDSSIDAGIEVLPYGITAKSVYFKGVFDCKAPQGYEDRTPQIGFMISTEYSTVKDIYEYGRWITPLKYKSTGDAENVYRAYVSDLTPGTVYYLFACAEYVNDKAYKVSQVYKFTTSTVKSDYNSYEYVDLGLSVKWAKCNVGAKSEYDTGGYYCWGETSTKSSYWPRDYKFRAGSGTSGWTLYSKYVTMSNCAYEGKVDNLVCLENEDDAARVNMGGTWRLPHDSEWEELIKKCTWEREYEMVGTEKHYTAVKITGPSGNHIVLPFGGIMCDDCVVYFPSQGHYLGAEVVTSDCTQHCVMYFSGGNTSQNLVKSSRDGGLSVRAVTE